jgi:hypothetical protein
MGKAERNRKQSAQQKIAVQRAAAKRAARRRQAFIAGGSVVVVVAIVVAFVLVKVSGNSTANASSNPNGTALSAATLKDVTSVPATTLNAVGPGSTYKSAVQTIAGGTPLTSGGKPQIVYVGAEYCPYCAAERWAMTAALSKFGKFTGLRGIHSSGTDVDPNTPTLTYYKSTYTSPYLVFSPTEAQDINHANLEPLTKLDNQLMGKYDVPPYVPNAQDDGSFPFVDFGNKYVINGASYDPAILAHKTWPEVAAALKDPSSSIAKGIDGATNLITAAICKLTNDKPATVCSTAAVTAASGAI